MPDITWSSRITWTLSPEVKLSGYKMRVCVSWDGELGYHTVRIFVNNAQIHPGGSYRSDRTSWFGCDWSWRLARQEHKEGGKTGPVDVRDVVLLAANNRISGRLEPPEPVYCALCKEAIQEVEMIDTSAEN